MFTLNSLYTKQNNFWPIVLVTIVPVLCLILFADKAFHVDDPLFIWTAQHIQTHPLNFYDFTVNWYGFDGPMYLTNQNPPGVAYFIVIFASLFGWSETVFHYALLLPAIAVSLGTYFLAKEFCSSPLLATLISILTPVFLVSSSSIMSDTMMLAFYVWAVVAWVYGLKYEQNWLLLTSALLITLSALSKYFGASLIPLLFVYTWAVSKKPTRKLLFLLLPSILLMGYEWLTYSLFGEGLILRAGSITSTFTPMLKANFFSHSFIGLCFVGGCYAAVFFYTPWLRPLRIIINGLIIVVLLICIIIFTTFNTIGITRWGLIVQVALFTTTGIQIIALTVMDLWKHRNSSALLLFLWVTGVFIFSSFVNWGINGRTLLPMLPVIGILVVRRLEEYDINPLKTWQLNVPLIPATIVALLALSMDYGLANSARTAAQQIVHKYKNDTGNLWFQGAWGFQYYMEKEGATKIDFSHMRVTAGDLMVVPGNNSNLQYPPANTIILVETVSVPVSRWGTTMNSVLGAGFHYSLKWGILPFAFGTVPEEKYFIYRFPDTFQK